MRPGRLDPEVLFLEQNQFPAIYADGTFTSPSQTEIDFTVWQDRGANDIQTAYAALSSTELRNVVNTELDDLNQELSALTEAGIHVSAEGMAFLRAAEERAQAKDEITKPLRERLGSAIQNSLAIVALTDQDIDYIYEALEITLEGTDLDANDRKSMRNLFVAISHHKSFPAHTK
jgi:hypothetical protein